MTITQALSVCLEALESLPLHQREANLKWLFEVLVTKERQAALEAETRKE
jgi:hypothetical protein